MIYKSAMATDVYNATKPNSNWLYDKLQIVRMNSHMQSLSRELIEKAGALEIGDDLNEGLSYIRLIDGSREQNDIAIFDQPVVLYTNTGEVACVCIDVRPFIKKTNSLGEWTIRVPYEFNFLVLRGVLAYLWASGEQRHIQSLSRLPCMLFSRWIADSISRRFGLNPETQMRIAVVAAIHYIKLFSDASITTVDKVRTVGIISAATDMNAAGIESILSATEEFTTSLDDFAEAIVQVADTPRLEGFNQGILLTAVTGVWYGPSGRVMAGIALQYPPVWIAMLLSAAISRGFSQSGVARLFYRTENKEIAQLLSSVFGLLRG